MPNAKRYSRGSILILALFVLFVLSLVAVSFAYRAGLESRLATQRVIHAKLRQYADSTVALAMVGLVENTNDYDHPAEPWRLQGEINIASWLDDPSEGEDTDYSRYIVTCSVQDEEGKGNVKYASSEDLEKVGMSSAQVASLWDWLDDDDIAGSEGGEEAYYNSLVKPHHCKNAQLTLPCEITRVKEFNQQAFYGEDVDFDGILGENEDDGLIGDPPDNSDGELDTGWVSILTSMGDGKININTVPRRVLEVLPISRTAVEQIDAYRFFDENSSGNIEDHVFRSVGDIYQLQGLTDTEKEVLASIVRYRSEHFRILVCARHPSTGLTYSLDVLAKVVDGNVEIMKWQVLN